MAPLAEQLLDIEAGQKVLVIGMNGSGKSVFASGLMRSWDRGSVVIFDPKDDPEAGDPARDQLALVHTAAEAVRRLPGRILYRPSLSDRTTVLDRDRLPPSGDGSRPRIPPLWCRWDDICRKLLALGADGSDSAVVVEHEAADLGTSAQIGPLHAETIRKGRSLGITLVLVTQRPLGIPVLMRSEAQHVVLFTLTDPASRREAAALLAPADHPELVASIRSAPLPLNRYWLYRGPDFRLRLRDPVPYRTRSHPVGVQDTPGPGPDA